MLLIRLKFDISNLIFNVATSSLHKIRDVKYSFKPFR